MQGQAGISIRFVQNFFNLVKRRDSMGKSQNRVTNPAKSL